MQLILHYKSYLNRNMVELFKDNMKENSYPSCKEIKAKSLFNIDTELKVPVFDDKSDYVPEIDEDYIFDKDTTLSILAGFKYNRRVMIQGYHGTGKSTHVEQVAARLNWRCIRINLDSHISRIDLIGKEAIVLENEKQITKFKEGIIPWALENGTALVFDEYDAGRPDVMFVIQRILEIEGKLTLLEQNRVIKPHPTFRLFCTTNTIGLGDTSGLYHGTQQINQGQMDRWNIVSTLNYLPAEQEIKIISSKCKNFISAFDRKYIILMVELASLTRSSFKNGDISTVMSPRTIITWAENAIIFNNIDYAFRVTFLNKCDDAEKSIIGEYYQRCMGNELPRSWTSIIEEKVTDTDG